MRTVTNLWYGPHVPSRYTYLPICGCKAGIFAGELVKVRCNCGVRLAMLKLRSMGDTWLSPTPGRGEPTSPPRPRIAARPACTAVPVCRAVATRHPRPAPAVAGSARARDLPGRLHHRVRAAADPPPERAEPQAVLDRPELLHLGHALVALRRVARDQPAVLQPDRGAARLRPGLGEHHALGGPADVAGHGRVRRAGVVQRHAAARAAGLGLGGLRRRAPADRPVLGRRCWPAPSTASAPTSWCTTGRASRTSR